jgi:hypothetical protein
MLVEDIVKEASKLPEEARASIAARLIHGLEAGHHHVDDSEILERISQAEADPSLLLSLDQFVSGIKRSGS